MSKKIPYGLKVRVRGDEKYGYIVQMTCNRFFGFNIWFEVAKYVDGRFRYHFDTFKEAQQFALQTYEKKLKDLQEEDRSKKIKKFSFLKRILWEYP